jgi:hypothetical protein
MRPILRWGWVAKAMVVLVAVATVGCATRASPSATPTAIVMCSGTSVRATLLPPGTLVTPSASRVLLFATEEVELATSSATACYLDRPTVVEVSVSSATEDVGSLTGAPSRVLLQRAAPVTLEIGSPVGCSHFSPSLWASGMTVTFPDGTTFHLGGMHLDVSCGRPLLLRF